MSQIRIGAHITRFGNEFDCYFKGSVVDFRYYGSALDGSGLFGEMFADIEVSRIGRLGGGEGGHFM